MNSSLNLEFSESSLTFDRSLLADCPFISEEDVGNLQGLFDEMEKFLAKRTLKRNFKIKIGLLTAGAILFLFSVLMGPLVYWIFYLFIPVAIVLILVFGYKAMVEHFEDKVELLEKMIQRRMDLLQASSLFVKAFKRFEGINGEDDEGSNERVTTEKKEKNWADILPVKRQKRIIYCLQISKLSGEEKRRFEEEKEKENESKREQHHDLESIKFM